MSSAPGSAPLAIAASKHHGLANDFLVILACSEAEVVEAAGVSLAELAVAMCDRLVGIGADGLIVGVDRPAGDADLQMILHNADGSRAEMSGNGIRCLAQAEAMRRGEDVVLRIATDGGVRTVEVTETGPGIVQASVEMGPVGAGPGVAAEVESDDLTLRAATGDLGNPHLVVEVADPHGIDVAAVGARFESKYPRGINVEFIRRHPSSPDTIELAVWERGVGITQACGTGATASATRAHEWGLVGRLVTVNMPGGSAQVEVPSADGESATLIGPSQFVAHIHWPVALRG
ncbi:MAG: diaminopimelate epimerase [Candidatus Poriferisodalaceae bacterium]|jgi:diaminopimelate epimerase